MPDTAEWGLITTAGVGVAGIIGSIVSAVLQRGHDRSMAREARTQERRSTSYVAALVVLDRFVEVAARNLLPSGEGYDDQGEPSRDELATNAAQLRAFGSRSAYEVWQQFEKAMWAFYGRHEAADRSEQQKPDAVGDTEGTIHDRMALANALDRLREKARDFEAIVRRELGSDEE